MPTVEELQKDKGFMSASPSDQIKYLASTDADFKSASAEDQAAYLSHITSSVPAGGASGSWEPEGMVSKAQRVGTGPPAPPGPDSLMRSKPVEAEPVAGAPSPDDIQSIRDILKNHTDQQLTKAGKRYGIDDEGYDFSVRDENRHRVERDQYVNDVAGKLPDNMVQNLLQTGQAYDDADSPLFSDVDRNSASKADRAKAIWEMAHATNPIAAPRDLSPLNMRVAKSLGLSPRAIDALKTSGLDDTGLSKMLAKLTRSQLKKLGEK